MVVVNLGAEEETVPEVVADAAADVLQEVIAAGVVDATAEVAARGGIGHVEAGAGDADSAQRFETELLAQLGLKNAVEVSQDGAVAFIAIVAGLAGAPGSFHVEAEAAFEADEVTGDAEVGSTLLGQVLKCLRTVADGGGHDGAATEGDVALLGGSEVAAKDESEKRAEQSQFSQGTLHYCVSAVKMRR